MLFLCFQLTKRFELGETKAAELAGMMTGKSDKAVREWRAHFNENGEIPGSKQGVYQRSGVLWVNEDLNKKSNQAHMRICRCERAAKSDCWIILSVGK